MSRIVTLSCQNHRGRNAEKLVYLSYSTKVYGVLVGYLIIKATNLGFCRIRLTATIRKRKVIDDFLVKIAGSNNVETFVVVFIL